MIYIVKDLASLEELKSNPNLKQVYRKIQLDENLPLSTRYSKQLNKYYYACGCQEGSMAVFACMVGMATAYFVTDGQFFDTWWKGIAVLVIAALLGKTAGIVYAKLKLNETLRALKKALATT
ncbi:hypothetical protein Q4603_09370 [Zobellia galactanivorans]|uniref:Hypothetical membrane protein n=1 Tax=Zobellia galactanivorans (strain DSM 12802 / CCUG 47099 / CIP 106680 / NCIMB 13871 / Dsij) TaxID=63186 RepID=G0L3H8_ZOBGA|nr:MULTISPECIES: hypothetical protein [Zobellia]MBU3024881.1 hypothetical protein [Zobellia galactanivorans]MDO6808821.1 hypothetical protein [Zobellia galactanivorans]OWW25789.1 hypothetical protein B4Q04_09340 [Zobellia sp. OII3]CAZ98433.1 Hypothetical membrane protein [Zobellia galactanivorans]